MKREIRESSDTYSLTSNIIKIQKERSKAYKYPFVFSIKLNFIKMLNEKDDM